MRISITLGPDDLKTLLRLKDAMAREAKHIGSTDVATFVTRKLRLINQAEDVISEILENLGEDWEEELREEMAETDAEALRGEIADSENDESWSRRRVG